MAQVKHLEEELERLRDVIIAHLPAAALNTTTIPFFFSLSLKSAEAIRQAAATACIKLRDFKQDLSRGGGEVDPALRWELLRCVTAALRAEVAQTNPMSTPFHVQLMNLAIEICVICKGDHESDAEHISDQCINLPTVPRCTLHMGSDSERRAIAMDLMAAARCCSRALKWHLELDEEGLPAGDLPQNKALRNAIDSFLQAAYAIGLLTHWFGPHCEDRMERAQTAKLYLDAFTWALHSWAASSQADPQEERDSCEERHGFKMVTTLPGFLHKECAASDPAALFLLLDASTGLLLLTAGRKSCEKIKTLLLSHLVNACLLALSPRQPWVPPPESLDACLSAWTAATGARVVPGGGIELEPGSPCELEVHFVMSRLRFLRAEQADAAMQELLAEEDSAAQKQAAKKAKKPAKKKKQARRASGGSQSRPEADGTASRAGDSGEAPTAKPSQGAAEEPAAALPPDSPREQCMDAAAEPSEGASAADSPANNTGEGEPWQRSGSGRREQRKGRTASPAAGQAAGLADQMRALAVEQPRSPRLAAAADRQESQGSRQVASCEPAAKFLPTAVQRRPRPPLRERQPLQPVNGGASTARPQPAAAGSKADAAVRLDDRVEELCTCPITQELLEDPVLASDGFTYERAAIEEWIARKGVSPMTDAPLALADLLPNLLARQLVAAFQARA